MATLKYWTGAKWNVVSGNSASSNITDIELKNDNLHLVSSGKKVGTGVEIDDISDALGVNDIVTD